MGRRSGIGWVAAAALAVSASAGAKPVPAVPLPVAPPPASPPSFKRYVENLSSAPQVFLSADGETLYIVGTLNEGAYLKVAELAEPARNLRRVYLASYGGITVEGRLIGLYIRRRKLDTYVEQVCASACTMAFVAGRERVLGPAARIGFHQGFALQPDGSILTSGDEPPRYDADRGYPAVVGTSGTLLMRQSYEVAGVDREFIDRALATPSEAMWYPGESELRAARFDTRFAAEAELPPPPGIGRPRDAVDADLAALPLWQAVKRHSPETYEQAADEVWRGINTGLRPSIARWLGRSVIVDFALSEMATAPDPIVDATIQLYGEMARGERRLGYASCRPQGDLIPRAPNPEVAAFAAREDALIVRFFTDPRRVPRMSPEEATKTFRKAARKIAARGHFDWLGEGNEADCRSGLQALEAIADLEPKRRASAYRAMLSLPAEEDAAKTGEEPTMPAPKSTPEDDRNRH